MGFASCKPADALVAIFLFIYTATQLPVLLAVFILSQTALEQSRLALAFFFLRLSDSLYVLKLETKSVHLL